MEPSPATPAPVPRAEQCLEHLLTAALALHAAKPIAAALDDIHVDGRLQWEIGDACDIVMQSIRRLLPHTQADLNRSLRLAALVYGRTYADAAEHERMRVAAADLAEQLARRGAL